MDAKIIAGILAAGGAALAAGGVYRMNKKTGYFKKRKLRPVRCFPDPV